MPTWNAHRSWPTHIRCAAFFHVGLCCADGTVVRLIALYWNTRVLVRRCEISPPHRMRASPHDENWIDARTKNCDKFAVLLIIPVPVLYYR